MPSDKNDLAQRVALCQPGDTVRGFIFKAVYGRVELRVGSAGLDRMLGRLRLHKRPMDSFSYPLVDFLRLLYEGADRFGPREGAVEAAAGLGEPLQRRDGAEHEGEHHVEVRQVLDALLDAGDGREDEADRQDDDDRHECRAADLVDPAVLLEAGGDLQGTEAERGRRAEERGEDGQDVDDLAADAVDRPPPEQEVAVKRFKEMLFKRLARAVRPSAFRRPWAITWK